MAAATERKKLQTQKLEKQRAEREQQRREQELQAMADPSSQRTLGIFHCLNVAIIYIITRKNSLFRYFTVFLVRSCLYAVIYYTLPLYC
jgi:hypothetical protein